MNVVVKTKTEAEAVVAALSAVINQYGFASVGDLKNLTSRGHEVGYRDLKIGWMNLDEVTVDRAKDSGLFKRNWIVTLPEPTDLLA